MTRRILPALIALALLVAACGGSEAATTQARDRTPITTTLSPEDIASTTTLPEVDVPGGFRLYKGDGFELFMPKTWTVVGFGDLDMQRILNELANSELEDAIKDAFESGSGKLFAFDFGNSSPTFTNNINIILLDNPGMSAAQLLDLAEKDIRRIGATNTEARAEQLEGGDAVIVSYDLPLELGGGEGLSYTVLTSKNQWVVTYTALNTEPFRESFELMMDSFRER